MSASSAPSPSMALTASAVAGCATGIFGMDSPLSCVGLTRPCRLGGHRALLSEMAGTGPAMTLKRLHYSLRRLLRVHFLDRAGLQVDLHAVDLIEVGSGHAHEARTVRIIDRVNGAILVNAGLARRKPVFLDRLELGVLGIFAVVLAFPLGHVGVFGRLAIDRPGRAVVMRRRDTGFVIDMGEDLEAELRVFVQHLQAARYVVAAIFLDEILVGEQTFEILADQFAPGRAGIARKGRTAIGDELVEVIGHSVLPGMGHKSYFNSRSSPRKRGRSYKARWMHACVGMIGMLPPPHPTREVVALHYFLHTAPRLERNPLW